MDFLLKPTKRVHALDPYSGYILPPMDGSLTVSEIYDFHHQHNPDHPVFVYPNTSGGITRLSYSEVVPAAHRAGHYVAKVSNIDLGTDPAKVHRQPVAIVASTDTITYFTTLLGMLRAEIPIFPISPRNSAPAIAHLLSVTRPSHVLVSVELAVRELAQNAVDQLERQAVGAPVIADMPTYERIYAKEVPFVPLPPRRRDLSATRIIVHSSGSSSFPKPIIWNDRSYLQVVMAPLLSAHDLCGRIFAGHAIAMFHAIGLNLIAWVSGTGLVTATFAPASPARTPTPASVYQGLIETSPTYAFAVPAFLEQWSRDLAKVTYLKSLKGVAFGGSPLNKTVGDFLTNEGVALYSFYGQTEAGVIGQVLPENPGLDWEYIAINPHCAAEFVPMGDGTYELVVVAKPTHELTVLNTKFRGQDAYATSDLLAPHPTKPGLWKVLGRADDQIMLSTGEKTNPGPLEFILCQHPHVSSAIMFGRGRFQNGVLVELKKEYAFDPQDTKQLIEFRNNIWSKVEEMNAMAPTHSRLFKEMIIPANPSKPFVYTPKGAPKRPVILAEYETEIEAVYAALEEIAQIEPPVDWSSESTLSFVRKAVNGVLKRAAEDDEDIFECGCDSLQATWIRNSILHALRRSPITSLTNISQNFIYDHPRITSLSQYIFSMIHSSPDAVINSSTMTAIDIQAFLARYTNSFPTHVPNPTLTALKPDSEAQKDVVLVTGTTGTLGSAVLAKLAASDSVARVFALNRRSKQGLETAERQRNALRNRGYNEKLLDSGKVTLIEGELTGSGLGLDEALENEIKKTVTHIIHIAWRVDFNLSLSSFESAIGGVRTLVDLALSSPLPTPPRLIFTSSVGVLRNVDTHQSIPEIPIQDPTVPLGQGYTESKWIAEQILNTAAKTTPLRPISVRVGQISGGINGEWNTSDWVPAIVKSSVALECLPEFKGICSWIPLDLTAGAIVEMRNTEPADFTVHLIHPRPARAKDLFQAIGEQLSPSLPLVTYPDWVKRLEDAASLSDAQIGNPSDQASFLEKIPAAKLLDFFQSGVKAEEKIVESQDEHMEAMGIPKLSTEEALKASEVLRNKDAARMLGADDVQLWLKHWKRIGFLL